MFTEPQLLPWLATKAGVGLPAARAIWGNIASKRYADCDRAEVARQQIQDLRQQLKEAGEHRQSRPEVRSALGWMFRFPSFQEHVAQRGEPHGRFGARSSGRAGEASLRSGGSDQAQAAAIACHLPNDNEGLGQVEHQPLRVFAGAANAVGTAAAVLPTVAIASLIAMYLKTIFSLPRLREFHE